MLVKEKIKSQEGLEGLRLGGLDSSSTYTKRIFEGVGAEHLRKR